VDAKANLIELPVRRRRRTTKRRQPIERTAKIDNPRKTSRHHHHHFVAAGVLIVALILVALSLAHLAADIQVVTGSTQQVGWSMAAGVDMAFITLELTILVAPENARSASWSPD
jgi:hypothetical protein